MPSTNSKKNKFKERSLLTTEEIYGDNKVLAFIIDGEVVQTFICDERFAAILESEPVVVDLTGTDPFFNGPHVGWKYDGESFLPPDIDTN
jgi:hypothetical protein